jgi:small subunit ribosomal protein S20
VANIKQQKKRILVAQRQRLENLRYTSAIKTYFRRLQTTVDSADADGVTAEHRTLVKLIDRAAARKALHPNTAARKKSRPPRLVAAGPRVDTTKKRVRKAPAAKSRKAAS